ncbi:ultraviolet-B receptor UVR8 [Selaginella moellendorffii]|uniref:ultraviolet-B receptor UVR8 n=1 Tax=Selaginella moellendorffii TaxID=88036 RepID=UPI000D1C5A73|nr:ultraviolet-B receptor UVR8 [Selaginella moellendorffii]|eukprot:XP_024544935.1 ultraviolet-B receptor UVR8 [Selaginella moellendorffii]
MLRRAAPSHLAFGSLQRRRIGYLADRVSSGEPAELEVWAWGRGTHGQVGHGSEDTEKLPVLISTLKLAAFTGMAPIQGRMPVDMEVAAQAEEVRLDVLERCGVFKRAAAGGGGGGGGVDPSLFVEKAKPRLGNVGVTCGLFHSVLFAEQDVFVWGKGDGGRLGIDTEFNQYKPYVNPRIKRVQMASAGGLHNIALTEVGNVYTWGYGAFGALGHGSYERELLPRLLEGPWKDRIVHVSAGGSHSAAVTESGELYTWGRDEGEGRLGHGNPDIMDEGALSRPTKVQALDVPIASVYCGGFFTMALTKSGQLWSWGGNANHELGHGTRANNWKPKVVAALEDVTLVQVACGGFHAAALTQDGKVITWGYGGNGQLGHGTLENGKEPAIVEAMADKTCTYIACGPAWTAAITENGDLYTWGKNRDYQLGIPGLKDEQLDPVLVQFPQALHEKTPVEVLGVSCGANHGVCIVSRPKPAQVTQSL